MFFEVFFVENVEFNFFENLKIIGGKFLPGKFFWPILEATYYRRQVKIPQVSAGWIATNKVFDRDNKLPSGVLPTRREIIIAQINEQAEC